MKNLTLDTRQSHTRRVWHRVLSTTLMSTILTATLLTAQEYRYWHDTTMPEQIVPKHIGQNPFPIGVYFYHYNHNYPVTDIWTYLDSVRADHGSYFVERFYQTTFQQNRWQRYKDLVQSAPSGFGVLPIPTWDVSVLGQIEQSREVTFYPFDSSQLGGIANTGMTFHAYNHDYERNVFTDYSYDSTTVSTSHGVFEYNKLIPRREVYYDTGKAGQTVASGIAFDFRSGQTERWEWYKVDTNWFYRGNTINSSALFDGLGFDEKYSFRRPYYLVVTGHLFDFGGALSTDTLLAINVYYEVSRNQQFRDSSDVGVADPLVSPQTADTNLRFLYKTLYFTKNDLYPTGGLPLDWNAHRVVAKAIDFKEEGMPGPTAFGVTARSIDLEIVYLGGEKVALHSVALRDTIAHTMLQENATGNAFRTSMRKQIDSLILQTGGSTYPKTVPDAIQNLYITDEPKPFSTLPLRRAKQEIEENYVYANGDSLTTVNGWAIPHLQWTGGMDWVSNGSYFTHYFADLGESVNLTNTSTHGDLFTIPSAKHHNGGRFTVPEMFDITQLTNPTYAAGMQARIDTMNYVLQYARLGAAVPGQKGSEYLWLVQSLQESAEWAQRSGRRHFAFIGPVNAIKIAITDSTLLSSDTTITVDTVVMTDTVTNVQDTTITIDTAVADYYSYQRDTILEHRPERSETRMLVRLALAYGAKAISYYTFESTPWARRAEQDSLIVKDFTEIGMCGLGIDDRTINRLDWSLLDPNLATATKNYDSLGAFLGTVTYDSVGVIDDLYVGWWDTYREVRETNEWVRRIAPTLLGLQWRDAYSLHFAVDAPYTTHDDDTVNVQHRPLPSDEIITKIEARHPVTGALDSDAETFVELGLFETRFGKGGGVTNDPRFDSNYAMILNRRSFETGNYDTADVSYPSSTRALLDTLSETRTYTIHFNLKNPDSSQYTFIRVREIAPDTVAPLPLLGVRSGLDTTVHADSVVHLTLGPGRAALLEITYNPGDSSMVDGDLRWNNQRKMVYFDDERYHSTYVRNDSVLYRRSMKMRENPGTILWEPDSTVVSTDAFGTRTYNWAPSITMRKYMGDTIVTIVWTAHSLDSVGVRDVLVRDLNLTQGTRSNIWFVDYHTGTDSTKWGDAVVNAEHGGDIIAWGDSTLGIVSRVRLLQPSGMPAILSARAQVSSSYHTPNVGRWPSVPTFAHRAAIDSNCGIAWNQPYPSSPFSNIFYRRIVQTPAVGGVPGIAVVNFQQISPNADRLGRPSIDQTQDVWHRVQEGVTWVRDHPSTGVLSKIWFSSLYTETKQGTSGDSIEPTQLWVATYIDGPKLGINGDSYPTTAALNEVYLTADSSKAAHFSVEYVDHGIVSASDRFLRQALIQYAEPTFKNAWPLPYAYDGDHPQGSSAPVPQDKRHAILYRAVPPSGDTVLRTTRQYFAARWKPGSYIAGGREVVIPVDDSLHTYFSVMMHDPWSADNLDGSPHNLVERSYSAQTDSLSQVEDLFRTVYFSAGDSTAIGLELRARFMGDSATAGPARISVITELVDSASGMVTHQLDSIALSAAADSHDVVINREYDLLSGTYYIRVRLDTASFVADTRPGRSRYPVAEYASMVESGPSAKFARRLGPVTGNALRLSAQPNPMSDRTELRFSIHSDEAVTITVLDGSGREVARLLDGQRYDAGRYAVELDAGQLPSGTYLVRLRAGEGQVVDRVVVRR